MAEISFAGLLVVGAVAFMAPLIAGLFPRVVVPSVALEVAAGIALGPFGFGIVQPDAAIHVLSTLGLAFLLFLAGMEIELEQLRGSLLRVAAAGWVISLALALTAAYALHALDAIINPLLIAITLSATALGLIVPVLKDAGESHSSFGQLVIAGASIAEFSPIVLVSLFFSTQSSLLTTKLILFAGLGTLILLVAVILSTGSRSSRVSKAMLSLQDTSAQIRVRGSMLLLLGATVAASDFRVDAILGAFLAGVVLSVVDRDLDEQYGHFRVKLDAVGHGVLIPVFWVTTGLNFNVGALTGSAGAMLRVPLFLLLLLLVRGLPSLVYRPLVGNKKAVVAGLLQATSLTFIAVTTVIGRELDQMTEANASALLAAGLLSVLLFPALGLAALER